MNKEEKAILYIYAGGVKEVLLNENARDNCTEPYLLLKKTFEEAGYRFDWEPIMDLELYDKIIFLDVASFGRTEFYRVYPRRVKNLLLGRRMLNVYEEALKKKLYDKLVLFLVEPASVCIENYDRKKHAPFPVIFTWNDDLVDDKKYFKFYPPVPVAYPEISEHSFKEKKLLLNISRNKVSKHPLELYSSRLEAIRFFEENYPDDFDLIGTGWEKGDVGGRPFKCYRGEVANKWDVIPNYKFSLSYENIYSERGYISEKIFDTIRCKSVPVYWGAPNITDYIPENAFIDRRKFSSNEQLASFLKGMEEEQYMEYRKNGDLFLQSGEFKRFLSTYYVTNIMKVLNIKKGEDKWEN